MKNEYSDSWKKSTQTRKQRKYQYNAPLHTRQNFVHSHLSKELIKKYGIRNVQLRKNDKVKIARGQFKGKNGKVEIINLKDETVQVSGIETIKKDGSKTPFKLKASNLIITELDLEDAKRKNKITKNKSAKK